MCILEKGIWVNYYFTMLVAFSFSLLDLFAVKYISPLAAINPVIICFPVYDLS